MTELNSGPYWNRTSGTCYKGQNNTTTTCDFTTTGLNATAKTQISSSKYYLGGKNGYDTASNFYGYERGTTVGTPGTGDTVTRTTNWQGNIGLMYPSDYGYATSGGTTTNRVSCLAEKLSNWYSSSVSDCKNNDWMYNSNIYQWTITPCQDDDYSVFLIDRIGFVDYSNAIFDNSASYNDGVWPVVHLKSTIKVISGSGTTSSPFILG